MSAQIARVFLTILWTVSAIHSASAQDQSVNPGINDSFRNPDVDEFVGRFEVESREVFSQRKEIVAACRIQPGQTVADIGAGTGLFTRMFSEAVGDEGRVIAVDIARKFLDHILAASRQAGQANVETVLCTADSTRLPAASVDIAFICDTYHHFEFPHKTLASLHRALKPGGRVILVDFKRIEGESSEWILSHVRAGQEVFESEIIEAGFKKVREERDLLQENYFVVFAKRDPADDRAGHRPGQGRGMGRGPGAEMRADRDVFHELLQNHTRIQRSVTRLENGVETLTESDDPAIAAKIQEHVASMHARVEDGRGLRFWDDLFVAVFQNYKRITMSVENTDKGVRVRETSDDPAVVRLIQAHADVVSLFVKHGFEEAHRNHAVPAAPGPTPGQSPKHTTSDQHNREGAASAVSPAPNVPDAISEPKWEHPRIRSEGKIVVLPDAAVPPRAESKAVFDIKSARDAGDVVDGVARLARWINLNAAAGIAPHQMHVVAVFHGDATRAVLTNEAYAREHGTPANPNLKVLRELREHGVELYVCGQALAHHRYARAEVTPEIQVATAALTVLVQSQQDGHAYLPY